MVKTYGVEAKAYLTPLPKRDTTIVSHAGKFSLELVGIQNLMKAATYPQATIERAIRELERICFEYELDRVEISTMQLRNIILDDPIWNGYISEEIFYKRLACNDDVSAGNNIIFLNP
jgi:hypothetical protein